MPGVFQTGEKNDVCAHSTVAHSESFSRACTILLNQCVCMCMWMFVWVFLWQPMQCLAGVTWGRGSSFSVFRAKHWLWHSLQLKDSNRNQTSNETWAPWEQCFYKFLCFVPFGYDTQEEHIADTQRIHKQEPTKTHARNKEKRGEFRTGWEPANLTYPYPANIPLLAAQLKSIIRKQCFSH